MSEQTTIQIRVDNELKEKAYEVFEAIGIDMPTAVRMFFKAAVRDGGLPFKANMNPEINLPINEKTDESNNKADRLADYIREQLIYDKTLMLGNEDNGITLLPLLYNGEVPPQMYIQLLMMVPDGKITRWEDMRGFLSSVYGIKIYTEPNARFPRIDSDGSDIPYWKIVSQNGVLIDDMRCSREMQKEKLQNAGIPVVQRGKMVGSYKVDNFKDYLFDFTLLKATKKTDK